jgi:hypothetical protein
MAFLLGGSVNVRTAIRSLTEQTNKEFDTLDIMNSS